MAERKKIVIFSIFVLILLLFTSFSSTAIVNYSTRSKNDIDFKKIKLKSAENDEEFEIIQPLCSRPVFAEKGGNFCVVFKSGEFERIYPYLSTAYEPIIDEINLIVESLILKNNKYYLTVKVPVDTPVELYNLSLIIQKTNDVFIKDSTPRSVSVIEGFDDNFTFIHITDFHIGDPRGFTESIRETIGFKSVKKCIEEINLLHPDFVLISGDLVFGQLYPFEYRREYKICYDMIQMFDVPTFLVPGNHDGYRRIGEDGLEFWKNYFGPLNYSFDYGNYHFTGVNSFDWPERQRWAFSFLALNWGGAVGTNQLDWIENDLSSNNATLNFMFLHHNPLWDTFEENFLGLHYKHKDDLLDLIYTYNVDMVLAGHVHWDSVTIENETIFLTTTTPESSIEVEDGYWGYRQIEIKNGVIHKYNYKEPKNCIPSYKINIIEDKKYTKTIQNDLDQNITVLLKFKVPKRAYFIEGGDEISTRENRIFKQYYIKTGIQSNSEKTVSLYALCPLK